MDEIGFVNVVIMKPYRIIRKQVYGDIYHGDAVLIAYWVYHNWIPSRGLNIVDINNVDIIIEGDLHGADGQGGQYVKMNHLSIKINILFNNGHQEEMSSPIHLIYKVDQYGNFINWEQDLDGLASGPKKKGERKRYKKKHIKTKKRKIKLFESKRRKNHK